METNSMTCRLVLGVSLLLLVAVPATGAEIITKEDLVQKIIVEDHLIRVADNALFLLDGSSSMNEKFPNTSKSMYRIVLDELKDRNTYFPSIGHNMGIYLYTGWKEIYPMQPYDREKVAKALEAMPPEGSGPTRLNIGLEKAEGVLKTLTGKTALFVFTDGTYTTGTGGKRPIDTARRLVDEYDVCLYVISSASDKTNERILENLSKLNACSRLISIADFINRPEYNSGALFEVKSTERVITYMDKKVVGLKAGTTFEFDEFDLKSEAITELKEVANFLKSYPDAWIVIKGYSDNIGNEEYNLVLSRQRAEKVAQNLINAGIKESRIVVQWYGSANPVATNDTDEGRAKNRRAEIAVGM